MNPTHAEGRILTIRKQKKELAERAYRHHVNESWWTRSSLGFLFAACTCVAIAIALLWFWSPEVHKGLIPTSVYVSLGMCAVFIIAHIKSQQRIHDRFQKANPEDYRIWQESRRSR